MITNEKQLQVTNKKLKELKRDLEKLEKEVNRDILWELEYNTLVGTIENLQTEIEEYSSLKNGNTTSFLLNGIHEIPELLIKARIAKGWTQAELAKRLGVDEQQIQRYEACFYSTASITKIETIIEVLEIDRISVKAVLKQPTFNIDGYSEEELHQIQNKLKAKRQLI